MKVNMEYSVERLDKKKLKDLAILYKAVYGYPPPKNYFPKKYNTNYTANEYIGFIAYNRDNIPVAYYGVMPCFIQYDHKTAPAAQSGDTMTHPQYRFKGLFVELAKKTFDLCKTTGIQLVFGFPNQNSYHGLVNKLEWKFTEYMERFSIPVHTIHLESLLHRFGWTKWIYQKYADWILRKYSLLQKGLPNLLLAEGFGGVDRSDHYLEYKTYNLTHVLKIGTAKVWIKIKNGFIIGDMDIANYDFDTVMNIIQKLARRVGVSSISFQISPGTKLHALFAAKHKPVTSFPVVFLNLGVDIPLDKIKFTFADIDIF